MRQRVEALVGPVARKMWVSTFHSACVRILRRDAGRLGYPSNFTIYDQADAERLTGYVIRDLKLDAKKFPARGVHAIDQRRQERPRRSSTTTPRGRRRSSSARSPTSTASTRPGWRRPAPWTSTICSPSRCALFRTCPDVLEHYQQRFEHVLVDEYQDTNRAQNEIVLLLAARHRNITVVGDSDQCLPPGTMVADARRRGPIEPLAAGDAVVGTAGRRPTVAAPVEVAKVGHYRGRPRRADGWRSHPAGTPHHLAAGPAHTRRRAAMSST